VLKSSTASLGGTLNLSELKGFVPTVGSTYKILNFNSEAGTFATVNGLTINSTEAYTVTYQPNDVLLTVVSTPAAPAARSGSIASGNSHLMATLNDFNAAYAVGGSRAVPLATSALASRQRMAARIGALDLVKKSRH